MIDKYNGGPPVKKFLTNTGVINPATIRISNELLPGLRIVRHSAPIKRSCVAIIML